MPHICADEIIAFLMLFPFVGVGVTWLRNKLKRKKENT